MYPLFYNSMGIHSWLLNPKSNQSDVILYAYSKGFIDNFYCRTGYYVFPALYLNSELEILSGDGSSSNPFRLSV